CQPANCTYSVPVLADPVKFQSQPWQKPSLNHAGHTHEPACVPHAVRTDIKEIVADLPDRATKCPFTVDPFFEGIGRMTNAGYSVELRADPVSRQHSFDVVTEGRLPSSPEIGIIPRLEMIGLEKVEVAESHIPQFGGVTPSHEPIAGNRTNDIKPREWVQVRVRVGS